MDRHVLDKLELWILRQKPRDRADILGKLICAFAHDETPTYEGVDEKTGPYKGPKMWERMCHNIGYHLGHERPHVDACPRQASQNRMRRVLGQIQAGKRQADEHHAMHLTIHRNAAKAEAKDGSFHIRERAELTTAQAEVLALLTKKEG